jgi:hypothetical protein
VALWVFWRVSSATRVKVVAPGALCSTSKLVAWGHRIPDGLRGRRGWWRR